MELPIHAQNDLKDVLHEGYRKHGNAWKTRTSDYYIQHAKEHIRKFEEGEFSDENDLAHAAADILLALECSYNMQ